MYIIPFYYYFFLEIFVFCHKKKSSRWRPCGGGPHFYRYDPLERRREIRKKNKSSRVLGAQGGPAHTAGTLCVAFYCFFFSFTYSRLVILGKFQRYHIRKSYSPSSSLVPTHTAFECGTTEMTGPSLFSKGSPISFNPIRRLCTVVLVEGFFYVVADESIHQLGRGDHTHTRGSVSDRAKTREAPRWSANDKRSIASLANSYNNLSTSGPSGVWKKKETKQLPWMEWLNQPIWFVRKNYISCIFYFQVKQSHVDIISRPVIGCNARDRKKKKKKLRWDPNSSRAHRVYKHNKKFKKKTS